MDVLLTRFLGLLIGETGYYQALLSVLQKENKALVDSKLEELNEAGKEKENIILKIRILEEQRLGMLEKVADSLGQPTKGLTLKKLSQLVEEPYSSQIKGCYSNLLTLTQSIEEINRTNRMLIMHSLELVRGTLSLLNNVAASNPVYFRTGKIQNGDQSGNVISGQI